MRSHAVLWSDWNYVAGVKGEWYIEEVRSARRRERKGRKTGALEPLSLASLNPSTFTPATQATETLHTQPHAQLMVEYYFFHMAWWVVRSTTSDKCEYLMKFYDIHNPFNYSICLLNSRAYKQESVRSYGPGEVTPENKLLLLVTV